MDLLMRLKSSGFAAVANEFREREKRLGGGLPLSDFVEIVLQGLARETRSSSSSGATAAADKRAHVAALVDLFDEIDVNGDGAMEFDEFTSFCVDAGMAATTRHSSAGLKHRYVRSAKHVIKTTTGSGCTGVDKVKWSSELKLLLAVENAATTVKLYDITGAFVAEVGGKNAIGPALPLTPRGASDELQRTHRSSGRQHEVAMGEASPTRREQLSTHPTLPSASSTSGSSATANGVFVLDAVLINRHACLALSTTDFVISFYSMQEPRRTRTPPATATAPRRTPSFELMRPLTITTTTAQLLLRFCEHADVLISSGNDCVLNVWKLLDAATKVLWKRLVLHQAMVLDVLEVPRHDLLVSCDLQRCVQLWDLHDCRPRGSLAAHRHGVKQLAYSAQHDLLLSAGFEFDALGWDLASRQVVLRLAGHRAPLVGVQIARFQTERAVTADSTGVFKVWDISRATALDSGGGSGSRGAASQALQLESIDPSQHIARFEPTTFVCMSPHSRDLWVATAGTATLHRFRSTRVQQADEIPLRAFYHYRANKFVVVTGPVCSVWDGETGTCIDEFAHVGGIGGSSNRASGSQSAQAMLPRANGGARTSTGGATGLVSNVHNGSDCVGSAEPRGEVLACVQDRNCRKVVVVAEHGDLGVFNALNFVQMRKCREVFFGSSSSSSTGGAAAKAPACGIVGLHYCSVNKLIVATDANESAILVIDDNTTSDAARGATETTVLRRLTHVPGGVAASAYGFHVCLVAVASEPASEQESERTVGSSTLSLWDFETLSFVAHCDVELGHTLHLLEFWDDFPVLLAADTLGSVYFYAVTPLLHGHTGRLLHSFANDRESTSGGGDRPATVVETANDDNDDDNDNEQGEQAGQAFLTETTTVAAKKLLHFRKRRVAVADTNQTVIDSTARAAASTPADPASSGCAVTAMRVIADNSNNRYLLVTGDERGVVRMWDLSGMVNRLTLSRIPEIKCRYLRRGYHPKAMFTRDYLKDATSDESQRASGGGKPARHHHHAGVLLSQDDWRAALLAGDDDVDSHFQLSQVDLKCLSRRRLEAKKKSSTAAAKPLNAAVRTTQLAVSANAALAAAAAFLGGQTKTSGGHKRASETGRSSFGSTRVTTPSASASQRRNNSTRGSLSDVHLVRAWQAHVDGITSVEVTRDPDIVVTCALDMRVFVWSWHGACLGKLFDAENVGRWPWRFAKNDAKRAAERAQVVDALVRDLELTPVEKAVKRRQTLYQEHTARKSFKDMQRINTIVLDHIISKNPELDVLTKAASRKGEQQVEASAHAPCDDEQPLQPQTYAAPTEPPDELGQLRLHSLAQVGPLLCVDRSAYRTESRTAAESAAFVEQDDLTMDKQYLEQELAISSPGPHVNTASVTAVGSSSTNSTLGAVHLQITAVHLTAKATFESRVTLERKAAEMYANLEQLKHRTAKPPVGLLPGGADLDTLLAPSAFLKQRIPAADLALRPQTAPVKNARGRLQQQHQLEKLSVSHSFRSDKLVTQGPKPLVRAARDAGLNGSNSAPLLLVPPQRHSVTLDRRKSSLDIGFVEAVNRHTTMHQAAAPSAISKRPTARNASATHNTHEAFDKTSEGNGGNDSNVGVGSLQKLRAINQILSLAHECCNQPTHETLARATTTTLGSSVSRETSVLSPNSLVAPLSPSNTTDEDLSEQDDDTFALESRRPNDSDAAGATDAVVRAHLEDTKRRMLHAMRDSVSSPHKRTNLRQLRRSAREQQRVRRMDDYLQQKRRELTTNIGNVFKRTSFAFQSKASDNPTASSSVVGSKSHFRGKPDKTDRSATVFGIYSIREVMAVIRLFWCMDEDGSGHISLDELLQYKHVFEKLGYTDMATVFQAIDTDGNGRVSLKELLATCFHYATTYQIDAMLKLAKVGNVRAFLYGGETRDVADSAGSGSNGGDNAAAALTVENRRELLEIFRVFDKNGDGGVSFQELMEALRVDDDDTIAAVMAEQAARKPRTAHISSCVGTVTTAVTWDATPSGITKEDVERLYRDFDADKNAALDFDEFVVLMRTLYGPKSNVYFR